jgi:hypothetical protein
VIRCPVKDPTKMFRLPQEAFEHQILPFLKFDEVFAFLSSSNSLFEELRYRGGKRNFVVTLNDLTGEPLTRLLQKISPGDQVIVDCNHCAARWQWLELFRSTPLLRWRLLMDPHCGCVSDDDYLKIQELSFHCYKWIPINCLSHLTSLSLNHCHYVHDIKSLRNIPNLTINDCNGIYDISALQNNKKLSIYNCENISLSTVNFLNILYLSTDLELSYDATTTLTQAISLKLSHFDCSAVFLSSTVVFVEIRNKYTQWHRVHLPLEINLSNFSHSLKSVLLEDISSSVDLAPLGNIEMVQLQFCRALVNVNGLGKNNKTVVIKACSDITDLSALKTVPRVTVDRCSNFVNCEDLNQVHHLTIENVPARIDFSGLKREKGCQIRRLELLECDPTMSFKGLDEIPFLKIISEQLLSLEGVGGKENKIIILEGKLESLADRVLLPNDCYSKRIYKDAISGKECLMLQLTRK